jgi:glutamine amidotransferase
MDEARGHYVSETIAIIDYGSGNLKSAAKAFEHAAKALDHAPKILVTNDPTAIQKADRIVLPGVGAFADCRAGLMAVPGLADTLQDQVIKKAKPFFGICVGMQLMAETGMEKGAHEGLGWIPGVVKLIEPTDKDLKIPHMGWNTLKFTQSHPLFDGLQDGPDGQHAYFVHSYHLAAKDPKTVLPTADYGMTITAIVGRDNMVGTQFHPEKSQKFGLALIENFLRWHP